MRLIYADNALKAFAVEYKKTKKLIDSGETHLDNLAEGFTEAAHIIKYIATTVDAVPVVRCKDCNGSQVSDDGKYIICCRLGVSTGFLDFCSYGERKEEM